MNNNQYTKKLQKVKLESKQTLDLKQGNQKRGRKNLQTLMKILILTIN